jgi:molybdenum cofactor cytidylyltransferase
LSAPEWYALVLAAGLSSRAGAFKPELPVAGRAVLHRVLDAFAPTVSGVFVVTGHEAARVENLIAEWLAERSDSRRAFRVQTVYNPDYAGEMMTSVLMGARAVPGGSFVFISPADYPLITSAVARALRANTLEALCRNEGMPDVFIPRYNGKNGHPVLLAPESLAALQALDPTAESASLTLKEFLAGRRKVYIDVDAAGVLEDLDTPEDYARIEKMLRDKAE